MPTDTLRERAKRLALHGLVARWDEMSNAGWVESLILAEEAERQRRSLERRVRGAHLGRFKPMSAFDWNWPGAIDRDAVEDLFQLGFVDDAANVILVGPNAVGKTMIAQNLAHQAVLHGHSVRFTTASAMLNDLASQDGSRALTHALHRYCRPKVLVVDEVGYLAYGNRHADLLFEVVTRRYGEKPIIVTTNKPFAEWNEVFPNATCVVTLVDRLVHTSEIIGIEGESYRLREAKERAATKAKARRNA